MLVYSIFTTGSVVASVAGMEVSFGSFVNAIFSLGQLHSQRAGALSLLVLFVLCTLLRYLVFRILAVYLGFALFFSLAVGIDIFACLFNLFKCTFVLGKGAIVPVTKIISNFPL